MREELEAIDTEAVQELGRIAQELDVLQGRLESLEARQETVSQEVAARVRADYEARLAALARQAEPLRARAREQFAVLQRLLESAGQARREVQLAREELELRHALGEFDDEAFAEKTRAVDGQLAAHEAELAEADGVAQLFLAAFGREAVPPTPVGDEAPAVAPAGGEAPAVAPAGAVPAPPAADPMEVEATAAGSFPGGRGTAAAAPAGVPAAPAPAAAGSAAPAAAPAQVPSTSAYSTDALEVARLVAADAEYCLQLGTTTIGRAPKNDVRIRDASVSREHAKIVFTERGFAIYDLGSENGVWVNGERVKHTVLSEGDVVELGPGVCPLVFRGP